MDNASAFGLVELRQLTHYPIWHARFRTKYQAAMSFLRMQEHYESPRFRGEVFDLETYMDWYAAENGNFTYTADWSGFNVPSRVVRAFRDRFPAKSRRERRFLAALKDAGVFASKRFYLIGTSDEAVAKRGEVPGGLGDTALGHEVRHGAFCCDDAYRAEMSAAVEATPGLDAFRAYLREIGYHEEVLTDEIHAYALTGWPSKAEVSASMKDLRRRLLEIEAAHLPGLRG